MTPRGARTVLIGNAAEIVLAAAALEARGEYALIGACVLDGAHDVVAGLPVLGSVEALGSALTLVKAERIVWAAAPVARAIARQILEAGARAGCPVSVYEPHRAGPCTRPLVLDDLLGAPQIDGQSARLARAFAGKRILVTGGGGSIGSEMMRRLAALAPARLVALDASELNLFNLSHDPALVGREDVAFVYADVRDRGDIGRVFARERPDIVFHAAAMKHVPIVEDNPSQGVLTNVLGTKNVAIACAEIGAHLVFVSTDKAVQPKSVMGATKRLAGIYCGAHDSAARRSIVVRLGNVLGSTGSAAPLFERQLERGGPITVTDPEAARFFVTVAQAGDFLLQAAAVALAPSAPHGAAFTLEMGEEIPIVDLASDIVRLSGQRPGQDVQIEFVGLRPGEKLREELIAEDETVWPTEAPAIRAVEGALPALAEIERRMDEVIGQARQGDDAAVKATLQAAVYETTFRAREAG